MKKIITLLTAKSTFIALWLCAANVVLQPTLVQAMQTAMIASEATDEVADEVANTENTTSSKTLLFTPNSGINVPNNIDFEVRSLGNRRFMVSFINKDSRVHIRIYDVIGNLIKEENTTQRGRFSQEYDMSKSKSEVYIVEVGDTKYSTTKRIFLN